MKILLIEDDTALGASLEEYLASRGFQVQWIVDELKFETFQVQDFDVLVLDLILKHSRGEDLLKRLREEGYKVPVLILTAKSGLKDKQECFGLGADDYLTKPFEPLELDLRLKALLRRGAVTEQKVDIGSIRVDLQARKITRDGEEVNISAKTWDVLKLLIDRRGTLVTKEEILEEVWPDITVGDDVVRHYIGEIRKLVPPESIVTYKARGYRLDI